MSAEAGEADADKGSDDTTRPDSTQNDVNWMKVRVELTSLVCRMMVWAAAVLREGMFVVKFRRLVG